MDPLSIAASVAGLIGLTGQLVRFGYTYASGVLEYRRELQEITNEAVQLSGILCAIQPLVGDAGNAAQLVTGDWSHQSRLESKSQILQVDEIAACEQTLLEITQELVRLSPQAGEFWKNTAKRLQWSLKRVPLVTLLARLERHKTTFSLALSAFGTCLLFIVQPANAIEISYSKNSKPHSTTG